MDKFEFRWLQWLVKKVDEYEVLSQYTGRKYRFMVVNVTDSLTLDMILVVTFEKDSSHLCGCLLSEFDLQ